MDLSLYLITDSHGLKDREFFDIISKAVQSGVTMVQLREKDASTRDMYQKAVELKKICSQYNVPLLINDRIDVAIAADADGVHLGTSDMPIDIARRILGKNKIIGATAKTVNLAKEAEADGADYFGIGAFFATGTKSDAVVLTPAQIAEVTGSVNIPAVGIGGLLYENMEIIKGSGVCGAAVSAAIMHAADVTAAVTTLKSKIQTLV